MVLKIDKGVPIPPPTKGGGQFKYPWHEMEVGDSFVVVGVTRSLWRNHARANITYAPKMWEARPEGKDLRVWRTK